MMKAIKILTGSLKATVIKFLPHFFAGVFLVGSIGGFTLRGIWNDYQNRLATKRQLELAEKTVEEGSASTARYVEQMQQSARETKRLRAELAEIPITDSCDSGTVNALSRVLTEAHRGTAARTTGRTD